MRAKHSAEDAAPPGRRILSKREVLARVPVSYTTLWTWMRQDQFPRSVILGPGGKVGWYEDEIAAWVSGRERVKLKPAGEPKASETSQPEAA